MKEESKLVLGSYQLICKDFGLAEELPAKPAEMSFEQLHILLTKQVRFMLDNEFERLLSALYRIDLAEEQVKKILHTEKPENVASSLAEAIINREKSKMITRMTYSE